MKRKSQAKLVLKFHNIANFFVSVKNLLDILQTIYVPLERESSDKPEAVGSGLRL